jgi:hypothetical protein
LTFFYSRAPQASKLIESKYRELIKLGSKMWEDSPEARPNCGEILKDKHLWALSENEFDFIEEMRLLLISEEDYEKNFVVRILEHKLITMKNKKTNNVSANLSEELSHF